MLSIEPSMQDDILEDDDGVDGGTHPFGAGPGHPRDDPRFAVVRDERGGYCWFDASMTATGNYRPAGQGRGNRDGHSRPRGR
jgi:hypothetical protein